MIKPEGKRFFDFSEHQLFLRLNEDVEYYYMWRPASVSEFLINLLKSLVSNNDIVLLDRDFSDDEIVKLDLGENLEEKRYYQVNPITTKQELVERILNSTSTITLFTSGTTGLPKKIAHSIQSLTRMTKISSKHEKDVWAFIYNPTHMAGLQVLLQAVLNWNTIIYLFESNISDVVYAIEKNSITHISATPTFYRMLLSSNDIFPKVRRVTLGGEKSDQNLYSNLSKIFPNARINNIYASTELGSLFVSDGDKFKVPSHLQRKIKVDRDELLVHTSLVNSKTVDEWFHTGDMVELVTSEPLTFKFLNRKSDSINVGGYKVNLIEVEDELRSLEGIEEVRVFAKPNSVLGNMIYAEIVVKEGYSLDKQVIVGLLKERLQDFKIPRIIKFVDSINKTRTGKLMRT